MTKYSRTSMLRERRQCNVCVVMLSC